MSTRRVTSPVTDGVGRSEISTINREQLVPRHGVSVEVQSPWRHAVWRYHWLRDSVDPMTSRCMTLPLTEEVRSPLRYAMWRHHWLRESVDPRSVLLTGKSLYHVIVWAPRSRASRRTTVSPRLCLRSKFLGFSHTTICTRTRGRDRDRQTHLTANAQSTMTVTRAKRNSSFHESKSEPLFLTAVALCFKARTKLNEWGRQKLGRQNSRQQTEHAKLYSDLLQAPKMDSSEFSEKGELWFPRP